MQIQFDARIAIQCSILMVGYSNSSYDSDVSPESRIVKFACFISILRSILVWLDWVLIVILLVFVPDIFDIYIYALYIIVLLLTNNNYVFK